MENMYDIIFTPSSLLKMIALGVGVAELSVIIDQRQKLRTHEDNIKELVELLISIYNQENLDAVTKQKIEKSIKNIRNKGGENE